MRALPHEREFAKFLLNLRDSLLNKNSDVVNFPQNYVAPKDADIIKDIYETIIKEKSTDLLLEVLYFSTKCRCKSIK